VVVKRVRVKGGAMRREEMERILPLSIQYDAEEEEEARQAKKQARLCKLEEQWKAEQRKSSSWWFWSPLSVSFPSNVLENLQVLILYLLCDLFQWTPGIVLYGKVNEEIPRPYTRGWHYHSLC
jgi:hypothetical protein